jgi:thioredoxin 1
LQEATDEQFEELTRDGLVLVDVWGPRCAPCIAQMPHVAKLEERHGGAFRVVKLNSADTRATCRTLRVFGLPTYIAMRDGVELERISGGQVEMTDVESLAQRLVTAGVAGTAEGS